MQETEKPHIGGVIYALRRAANLKQAELAALTGVHPVYISRIESGDERTTNMKLDKLEAFARAFNLRTSDLIGILDCWKEARAAA